MSVSIDWKGMDARTGILEWLEGGVATDTALAEVLGKQLHEIRYHLKRLVAEDEVEAEERELPNGIFTVYRAK